MKTRASITLSSEILAEVDRQAAEGSSRSAFIETVLSAYFQEHARKAAQARDLERINAAAARLNEEAADVLEYQA